MRGEYKMKKETKEETTSLEEEYREVIVEKQTGFNYREVIIIMAISILFGFLIGNVVNFVRKNNLKTEIPEELEELVSTYEDIEENYYQKISKEELLDAAIAGMIGALGDPYSNYIAGEASKEFNQMVDGEYVGIGTSVGYQDNHAVFLEINDKGPAAEAGLKVGDILVAINNENVEEKSFTEITSLMQGEKGTKIKLKIRRKDEEKEFTITRQTIPIESVHEKVYEEDGKKIGYIKVDVFAANTKGQFEKALKNLEKKKIDSLILDVRDNPGGHLNQATEILSLFLDKKKVMYQIETKGKKQKTYALNNEKRTYPIAVIINQDSASAAEIVASSLKESYKATLVGVTSYGKGTVQRSLTLKSGSTIKYTTEKWYTAKGNYIGEKGITPDVVVEQSEIFKESQKEQDDTQLQKALEILKQK